jgi:4-amino-4-deoxy-L-arabinose transferase-like glycosyltransferase
MTNVRKARIGAAIFLLSFVCLYWIAADILEIAGDEGMYLEGGRRIAMGQQPYRDFFVLTGPLTFWIQGVLAHLSAMKLAIMRLPVILDAAFLAWAVYWLASRYTGSAYAAGAAFSFLAYESRIRILKVNHRWDSGALATAAIVTALAAHRSGRRELWAACGILLAAAAWATPSMAIVALPLLAWSGRKGMGCAAAFLAGGAITSGAAGLYLHWHGALLPMIESLRWTGANYTAPNRVPYGSVWAGAMPDAAAWQYAVASGILMVPAVLPLAAIFGWMWLWRTREKRGDIAEMVPLLGAAAALTLTGWPRWTSDTLLHTMALSWFLCALLLYRLTTPRQRFWWCGVVLVVSAGSLLPKLVAPWNYPPQETRVGTLRDPGNQGEILDGLERWVSPGDTLFSFPYLPSAYYFLDARNPSRYTFLQPGMMTSEDERRAVADLQLAPPRWVVYENFPPDAVFRIWPGTDPARIPMTAMNEYLSAHYRQVDSIAWETARLVVMERVPAAH